MIAGRCALRLSSTGVCKISTLHRKKIHQNCPGVLLKGHQKKQRCSLNRSKNNIHRQVCAPGHTGPGHERKTKSPGAAAVDRKHFLNKCHVGGNPATCEMRIIQLALEFYSNR